MFILSVILTLLKAELIKMVILYLIPFPLVQYDYTPLGAASEYGNPHLVRTLLLRGFEVDGRDKVMYTSTCKSVFHEKWLPGLTKNLVVNCALV